MVWKFFAVGQLLRSLTDRGVNKDSDSFDDGVHLSLRTRFFDVEASVKILRIDFLDVNIQRRAPFAGNFVARRKPKWLSWRLEAESSAFKMVLPETQLTPIQEI